MATLPVPNPIVNNIFVSYQYQVSPTTPLTSAQNLSNTVTIQVNTADITAIKSVDNKYAKVGSTLTYTVTLANSGNVSAQNVILIDTVPINTTFVPNSLSINGTTIASTPNYPGVTIPDIESNTIATVTWQVTVNTMPTTGRIPNSAVINYSYSVSPTSAPLTTAENTNVVLTTINYASIDYTNGGGLVKSSSVKYAALNDTITYTISLKNTGNTTATNVVLTDTIPINTSFVIDSVMLNGVTQPGVYPYSPLGVPVGTLGPNARATVTFKVIVTTIPTSSKIENNSTVSYKFTVNPASVPDVGYGNSNTVSTTISQAYINNSDGGIVKSSNSPYAKIGDLLTYTVNLTNTGNATATNIIFKDTIPTGTSYVANTFAINGAVQSGANPESGVNIGNLAPNTPITVTFNVIVTTIPIPNPTSNVANLLYNYIVDPSLAQRTAKSTSNIALVTINSVIIAPQVGFTAAVTPQWTIPGDTLTYAITIRNTGNTTATNVIVYDTIPTGTTFISDSVAINSVVRTGVNPQAGVTIPDIPAGGSMVITFMVLVNS